MKNKEIQIATTQNDTVQNEARYKELYEHFLSETATIPWIELQQFYAKGQIIISAPPLDLIDVAVRFAQDDTSTIAQWINQGLIEKAQDQHNKLWYAEKAVLWAVVAAPWVVVQETKVTDTPS